MSINNEDIIKAFARHSTLSPRYLVDPEVSAGIIAGLVITAYCMALPQGQFRSLFTSATACRMIFLAIATF